MLQNLKSFFGLILVVILILVSAGCHHYYKAITKNVKDNPGNTVDSLRKEMRYFILRTPGGSWYMSNPVLSEDRKTITCTLDALPSEHQLHIYTGKGNKQYKEAFVLNEVHMYIAEDIQNTTGTFTLPLDHIRKIEVIEKDGKRTTNSYVIGALGYTVGALAVAAIIIAATKTSCPFVSANTGSESELQGEIYGGAIYPHMARDDYMPLRMKSTAEGTLQIKISNELKEQQYTDFADLLVITHKKNVKVLSDDKGNLYQVNNCELPLKAFTGNQPDALAPLLKAGDNRLLHFDDTLAANANNNNLVVQFKKPVDAKNGKLVLAIKNSYWLDYLYGEMAKGFGSYFAAYSKKQHKTPVAELIKWTKDQKLPLSVEIKTNEGWQKITDITTIGPLAPREIVVPVELSGIAGSSIEIRLSSGFMFWEIDYAGIDYSLDKDFEVDKIAPSSATDETGKDVLPQLNKRDGIYLEQPVPGNVVTLEYKCKAEIPNTSRSYILYTKGYYEHVREFKGKPNVAFLKQFKHANAFPEYSLQLYKKFQNTTMSTLAKQ